MANSDKNIRIITNKNKSSLPNITFTGYNNDPVVLNVLDDNTISFEGSSGQLFSVSNSVTSGTIFSVNDISGIPSFRIDADGTVGIAEFSGNVGIGLQSPQSKLSVGGDINASIGYSYRINGTMVLNASSLGTGVTLSALTSVGTVSSGTWQGSPIGVIYGGTGGSSASDARSILGAATAGTNSDLTRLLGVQHLFVTIPTAAAIGITVKAAVSQSASLMEFVNSSNSPMSWITKDGTFAHGAYFTHSDGRIPGISVQRSNAAGIVARGFNSDAFPAIEVQNNGGGLGVGLYPGGLVYGGVLQAYSTTGSTNTTTGALIVAGGAGIAGSLNTSTSFSSSISGLRILNASLSSSTGTIAATNKIQVTVSDSDAFLVRNGGGTNIFDIDTSNSVISVLPSTGSTNSSTGALVVTGGVGIGGTANIRSAYVYNDLLHVPGTGNTFGLSFTSFTLPTGFTGALYAIYAENKFVATGGSVVAYSDDSINWTTSYIPWNGAVSNQSITYGNGVYVVTSSTNSYVAYSRDLSTWTLASVTYQNYQTAAYGNGRFVINAGGVVGISTNGANWSSVTPTGSQPNYQALKFQNGYFYSSGSRSVDGIAWEPLNISVSVGNISYGNGLYFGAQYNSSNYAYSYDGVNFTAATIANNVYVGTEYHNGVYYLRTQHNNAILYYSTDGFNYQGLSFGGVGQFAMAFGKNKIVIFGRDGSAGVFGYYAEGTNGKIDLNPIREGNIDNTVIGRRTPKPANFTDISSNGYVNIVNQAGSVSNTTGALVVRGGVGIGQSVNIGGKLDVSNTINYTATNSGIANTWTRIAIPSPVSISGLTYGNGLYVGVGYSAATSTDGITWTARTLPHNLTAVKYVNNLYIGVNLGSALGATSSDGITWRSITLPASANWDGIAYGNGVYVISATYNSNIVAYSYNGINWTLGSISLPGGFFVLRPVIFGGGYFLTGSNGGTYNYTSVDGINWTQRIGQPAAAANHSTYGDGAWVTSGSSASLMYTKDFINWTVGGHYGWTGQVNYPAYTNGTFAIVDGGSLQCTLIYKDLSTVVLSNLPGPSYATTITAGEGKFVAGAGSTVYITDVATHTFNIFPHNSGEINNVRIGAKFPSSAQFSHLNANNLVSFGSSAPSTSTTTGALVITGGVGIGQSLFTSASYSSLISGVVLNNGSVSLTGTYTQNNSSTTAFAVKNAGGTSILNVDTTNSIVSVLSSTASTSTGTGALTVSGGVGIGGTLNILGNATIGGTLNVSGSNSYFQNNLYVGNNTQGRLFFSQATLGSAGTTVIPSMAFIGATNSPITLSVLPDNSLSFDGSSGQLFSINNNLSTGWIFSINDISGLPIFRTNADLNVAMGEYGGNVGIGLSNAVFKLQVVGNAGISGTTLISNTTSSTNTTSGALVVAGGVGIGGSVNVGGRVGIGTNLLTAALNITTPSASNSGIIIQGSTSQSESLFRVNSSIGGSFFEITNTGIVNIKTSTAGDHNSVPLQRWYNESNSIVGVMQKGGFFYTGNGLGYVDGAGNQSLIHQWIPASSYYITNWSKRMANGTQIMFSSSAGGDVRIYGDTNGSLTFQSFGAYTNNTMVKLRDPNYGTNQALLGIVTQDGSYTRSQLFSYGNLSLNMTVAGPAGTDWDTTNLFRANVYTKTKYLGNLAVLAVDDTDRFVVGPYGNTTVALGGTTVSTGLIIKGASSQTGNLFEVQSSTGSTLTYIDSTGDVYIGSSIASTNPTTGALVVSGGVGIGGSLFTSTSYPSSISGVVLNNGSVSLIGTYTQSNSSTTAFAVKNAGGTSILNVDTTNSIVSVLSSTASTGSDNGALTVSGGVGIGGSLFVGNTLSVGASTASTSINTGALIVTGGAGISGNINASGIIRTGLISIPTFSVTALGGTGALTPSTTYYYRISALDYFGNESLPSNEVSITLNSSTYAVYLQPTQDYSVHKYKIFRTTTSGIYTTSLVDTYMNYKGLYYQNYLGYQYVDRGKPATTGSPLTTATANKVYLGSTDKSSLNSLNLTGQLFIQNPNASVPDSRVGIQLGQFDIGAIKDGTIQIVQSFTSATGGTLTAGTNYYYKFTTIDYYGNESFPSKEYAYTADSNGAVQLNLSNGDASILKHRWYRTTTPGNYTNSYIGELPGYIDINYPTSNVSPPTNSTSYSYYLNSSINDGTSYIRRLDTQSGVRQLANNAYISISGITTSGIAGTLAPNTTYYYKIAGFDRLGNLSSSSSPYPINTGPATSVQITSNGVTWINGEDGFIVWRSTSKDNFSNVPSFYVQPGAAYTDTGNYEFIGTPPNSSNFVIGDFGGYNYAFAPFYFRQIDLGAALNNTSLRVLSAPARLPEIALVSGGTLTPGAVYYYKVMGFTNIGAHGMASAAVRVVVGAGGAVQLTFYVGITSPYRFYNVYRTQDLTNWTNSLVGYYISEYNFTDIGYSGTAGSPVGYGGAKTAADTILSGGTLYTQDITTSRFRQEIAAPSINSITGTTGGILTTSTTYYYRIAAIGQRSNEYGQFSKEFTYTTSASQNAISLAWGRIPGATGYVLIRSTNRNASAGSTSIYVNDLSVIDYGYSTRTHPWDPYGAYYPGSYGATFHADGRYQLPSLEVFNGTDPSLSVNLLPPTISSAVAGTGGTLANNTNFYYLVEAYDYTNNRSMASTEIVVNTGANNAVTLTWNEKNGAFYYKVYRSSTSNFENRQINQQIYGRTFTDINYPVVNQSPLYAPGGASMYRFGTQHSGGSIFYGLLSRSVIQTTPTNQAIYATDYALRLAGRPANTIYGSLLELGDFQVSGFAGSTAGTYLGLSSATGFTGNYVDFQMNYISRFKIDYLGNTSIGSSVGSGSTSTGSFVVSGGVGIGQSLFTSPSYASSISGAVFSNGSATLSGTYTQNNSSTTAFAVRNAGGTSILNVDTTNSIVSVLASVASTNTSTGALVVNGGLGVSGQLSFSRASFGFTGITSNPTMAFIGNTTSSPINLTVLTDNSLSWEGSSGQLFSIDNNLTSGEIFSVSDISGLPIISASAGQTVAINEFGGFTRIGNGSVSSTGASNTGANGTLVVYGGIGITGNASIGGAIRAGGGLLAKNISNGDIALDNGSADTPGVLYYWQNNRNFGTDVFFSGAGTTRYRIVKELNESGGSELWSIDRDGIVSRSAWGVGETINTSMYNNTDLNMSATTTINSTTYTNVATITYTPRSSTSYLWIEFDANYDYSGGTVTDDFFSRITVGGSVISERNQIMVGQVGGGTRSGVIFPISGRYTNSTTSGIAITVQAKWGTADDNIRVYGSSTSGYMRIQEIGR
jgi:hypothetical protein